MMEANKNYISDYHFKPMLNFFFFINIFGYWAVIWGSWSASRLFSLLFQGAITSSRGTQRTRESFSFRSVPLQQDLPEDVCPRYFCMSLECSPCWIPLLLMYAGICPTNTLQRRERIALAFREMGKSKFFPSGAITLVGKRKVFRMNMKETFKVPLPWANI